MKILAASIIKNAELFIESMITSISWVNQIVIYDDHSSDKTRSILSILSRRHNIPKLTLIEPLFQHSMINYLPNGSRDLQHEMKVRNTFLDFIFSNFKFDALVLIDGDELISRNLKPFIEKVVRDPFYNSIAITCNHIFDKNFYLHVYEAVWNGVLMVDPHVRVLTRFQKYQKGEYENVPDCFLKPTSKTLCLDGAYHYHLKYIKGLKQNNYAFRFLPRDLNDKVTKQYLRKYRFPFPNDLKSLIDNYLD
ncbi:MAG: hypothetical protein KatS3mg088_314 [Patescibacteria group bacterium]|nr:MAG: hypothetical protein KatS3mg088_314 [Patescibacteria group bacterium]